MRPDNDIAVFVITAPDGTKWELFANGGSTGFPEGVEVESRAPLWLSGMIDSYGNLRTYKTAEEILDREKRHLRTYKQDSNTVLID